MNCNEFRKLTFLVDYDRPKLPLLTQSQRIEYFRRRANRLVLRPLRQLLRAIPRSIKRSSAVLCFGTSICCAIEAFGRFHTGKVGIGSGAHSFKAFVNDFMHPDYSKQLHGRSYVTLLHDNFRNGLAHGFTIKWGGFEYSSDYFQVKAIGPETVLEIDPGRLYEDFANGTAKFMSMLKTAPDSSTRHAHFNSVFNELWVKGG